MAGSQELVVKPLKLAMVAFADIPQGGAVANRIMMLGSGLSAQGNEVHILAPYRFTPGPLYQDLDGVRVHWSAVVEPRVSDAPWGRLRKRLLLYRAVKKLLIQGLDWLILYDMGLDGLPFLLLAHHFGCRVAADVVDTRWLSRQPTLRELFYLPWFKAGHLFVTPKLQLNIAISRYLENRLSQVAPQVPRIIVPAPVNLDKFKPREEEAAAWRQRFGLQDVVVIGYFGSKWLVKGLGVLLEAAAKLRRDQQPFKLLITGTSTADKKTLELIQQLGLQDQVVVAGYLPFDEMIIAMSAADILVEPKVSHKANEAAFPQKLAEYLAMGKAVVASAVGDIPFYLQDQQDVWLCPPGDSEALARALARLIGDGSLRAKLAGNAREAARRIFDCHRLAAHIDAAFRLQEETV